jgi:hypothetical protein
VTVAAAAGAGSASAIPRTRRSRTYVVKRTVNHPKGSPAK